MRSSHSGFLAGVLGWGMLVQGRYSDTLAGIRGRHWGGQVGFGVAALPVLLGGGIFVCVGIDFRLSRFWQIGFWCSSIVCQAFGWWSLVSGWAVWLFRGWPGRSGMMLGVFLVHCVLCYAGGSDSACWWEMMDGGTLSPYIFLFMILLIPFHVIG